jgi:hypothetical protein
VHIERFSSRSGLTYVKVESALGEDVLKFHLLDILVEESRTYKEFVLRALKEPVIAGDDGLVAIILDDSQKGYYKTHKGNTSVFLTSRIYVRDDVICRDEFGYLDENQELLEMFKNSVITILNL